MIRDMPDRGFPLNALWGYFNYDWLAHTVLAIVEIWNLYFLQSGETFILNRFFHYYIITGNASLSHITMFYLILLAALSMSAFLKIITGYFPANPRVTSVRY